MRHVGQAVIVSLAALLLSCQEPAPAPPVTPAATASPKGSSAPAVSAVAASPTPPASSTPTTAPYPSPSMRKFSEDVEFLNQHGAAIKVLESATGGRIAV